MKSKSNRRPDAKIIRNVYLHQRTHNDAISCFCLCLSVRTFKLCDNKMKNLLRTFLIYLFIKFCNHSLTRLVWCSSIAYVTMFLLEHHVYKSIHLQPGLVFSLFCHLVTIMWLGYFHAFKPYKAWPHDVESESLLTHGLPIAKQIHKRSKLKHNWFRTEKNTKQKVVKKINENIFPKSYKLWKHWINIMNRIFKHSTNSKYT